MNMHRTATSCRGWAALLLLTASVATMPAWAACNSNSPKARIDPASQTVAETTAGAPTVVHLDGGSSTPNGVGYAWTYLGSTPAGLGVTLSGANTATPTFNAPAVGAAGASLQFRLTVNCGSTTNAASTVVNVTDVVVNNPPTAVGAVSPASAHEGDTVTLDGSGSYDLDPGSALTYQWVQIGGTPTVTLSDATPNHSVVTFVAPNVAATASLTFRLTVSDGSLTSFTDKIANILWTNDPPVARLNCPVGGAFVVNEGAPVTFNGSTSSDGDGGIASYAWEQIAGTPNLGVGDETGASVSFNAPSLSYNELGSITLRLTVTDTDGAASSAECGLFIRDVTAPGIAVPADITAEADSTTGATVSYNVYAQDAVDDAAPYLLACVPPSGSVFALAPAPGNANTTAVACTATDSAGNTANAGFNITVHDTTPPVITVPGAFGVEATGPTGAVASYTASTTDIVDGTGTPVCVPASGSTFPLGDTTVSCDASDARGNAATAGSFVLTVHDTTAPSIDAHDAVGPVEATGPAGAPVSYTAPATHDLVDGNGTATCVPASGTTFALGTSSVTCSAVDAAGNAATDTHFDVTVADSTPPTIDAHADITGIEATSAAGAVVNYTTPATHDLVDGDGVADCAPATGATFALGTTTVTCSATDAAGNHAAATSFDVTVVDTTPPTIDAMADILGIEATGPAGAAVAYLAPATHDAVDGDGTADCAPVSGSTFALGTTTVHCNASDAAGNAATGTSFDVEVVDTTPPSIDAHADILGVEATGPGGATVSYSAPATHDVVDGVGTASCTPASASTFALGSHPVTCTASDAAGNAAAPTTFNVQVVDTTAPVIAAHGDVGPIEATGPGGASVNYTRPATSDAVDGPGLATCAPPSGTTFALGSALVTCDAADAAGNHATTTSFHVSVVDTTPPVIAAHADVVAEATGPGGAIVGYASPATSDLVDGAGTASCAPLSGSTFALGITTVHCAATDAAGNPAAGTSFTVTVRDTTPPVIAPHADVTVNATGNSSAIVSYTLPTASDLVDGSVAVSCTPASGTSFNVGATTVTCSAEDARHNAAGSTFTVRVNYSFAGFFQPIDNSLVNTAKAGSAIPVKFSLGGNQGLNIFASNSPASIAVQCDTQAPTDEIETTITAGGSTLQYDAGTGQYIYVWKTEKTWLGCRQLRVTLKDGSVRTALFKFR